MSAGAADRRPNQNRLVATAIILSRIQAPIAPPEPTTTAMAANSNMRASTL